MPIFKTSKTAAWQISVFELPGWWEGPLPRVGDLLTVKRKSSRDVYLVVRCPIEPVTDVSRQNVIGEDGHMAWLVIDPYEDQDNYEFTRGPISAFKR